MATFKSNEEEMGFEDFPVSHTSVFTNPMMFPGVWLSCFLGHVDA